MVEPRYETKSIQVYFGLDSYHKYLPYFGWEIMTQQKINYNSESTSSGSSKPGIILKRHYTNESNSKTVHYYYTELMIRRKIGIVPQPILDIENEFFNNLRTYVSPGLDVFKFLTIAFFSWIVTLIFLHNQPLFFLIYLIPLSIIAYMIKNLWETHVWKTQTYPSFLKSYMDIIQSNQF